MDKINTAKARKPLQEIPKTNFSNQPEDNNVERQGTYRDGVSQRREKAWPGEKKEMRKDNKRCKEIASMSVPDYIYGRSHMDVIIIKCTINYYNTIRI